jgi:hypothetical protein
MKSLPKTKETMHKAFLATLHFNVEIQCNHAKAIPSIDAATEKALCVFTLVLMLANY